MAKTLSPRNPNDRWFYHTLVSPDPYNLNIDFDEVLGLTKLWLNIPIVKNGKRIGVMGVGFDYTHFIDEYIAEDKKGFTTMILNSGGAIVAHKEKRYVNYRSEIMDETEWTTLMSIADKGHNEKMFPRYFDQISSRQAKWVSFDLYLNGRHYIASATYLPQLKWINLSMVDLDDVFGIEEMAAITLMFMVLTLLSWVVIHWFNTHYLIRPIQAISDMTHRVKEGDYSASPDCDLSRRDEIGQLCRDINAMAVQIDQSARHAQEQYRWLADNTSDVIWIMELNGRFTYISPSIERLRGFTAEEVISQTVEDAVCAGSLETVQKAIAETMAEAASGQDPQVKTIVIEQPRKDGSTVWTEANARLVLDKEGKPLRFIGSTRDISERKTAEEEIRKLAFYDPLTGLANRRLLLDRLQLAILSAKRNHTFLGLIYLDLDNFKPLNDRYGHEVGDELLVEVGERLRDCIRATDTAARFGGDEFVVLLNDLGEHREKGVEYTEKVAQKITDALSRPYHLKVTRYSLTASIGSNAFGEEIGSTNEAISVVDRLMYKAKASVRKEKEATEPSE
jgi:diguanylate cyclase (GGDEF)-like protein/PAS domain S-box-containing protein